MRTYEMSEFANRLVIISKKNKIVDLYKKIGIYDKIDILNELRIMEEYNVIVIENLTDNSVKFKLTRRGKLDRISYYINLYAFGYFIFMFILVLSGFFFVSITSFSLLEEAYLNQNSNDIVYYSSKISFYLTISIFLLTCFSVVLSFLNRKNKYSHILKKISRDLNIKREKDTELIIRNTETTDMFNKENIEQLKKIEFNIEKLNKNIIEHNKQKFNIIKKRYRRKI